MPSQINGRVYVDCNLNGTYDSTDHVIPGVTVTLTGQETFGTATVNQTVTTDANGVYQFTNLQPGTYQIRETQPATFEGKTVVDGPESIGTAGGNATVNDFFQNVIIDGGDVTATGYDFAELQLGAINGQVFLDLNSDNTFNGADTGISGVTLTLTGSNHLGQAVSLTTTTGSNGTYAFNELRPGTYQVVESQPAGLISGTNSGTTGTILGDTITNISLDGCGDTHSFFFPERNQVLHTISGFVYEDDNNDGVKDPNEAPIPGTTIALLNISNGVTTTVGTTTTNSSGFYQFTGLAPGTYRAVETQPASYNDGKDTVGTPFTGNNNSNDLLDQIVIPNSTVSINGVNFNFGERRPIAPLHTISGFVYEDDNNDGVKDVGEAPIAGTTVTLLNITSGTTTTVGSTTTNGAGFYQFTGLASGTYRVLETQPPTYIDGKDTVGTPFVGNNTANDVLDQVVIPTSTVQLDGVNYNFGERRPAPVTHSISGLVYEDCNNNGAKDATEDPIPGVTVTLLQVTGGVTTTVGSTTTNANGEYSFTGLQPGTYLVRETQPAGFLDGIDTPGTPFGGSNATNDNLSPLVIPNSTVSLNGTGYNFGELDPSVVSGFVYLDTGLEDAYRPGLPGIGGVTVTLSGVNDLGQTVNLTTTTGRVAGKDIGYYEFTGLRPGTYSLVETLPAGPGLRHRRDYMGTNTTSVDTLTRDGRLDFSLAGCVVGANYNFSERPLGEELPGVLANISGYVYYDVNCTGQRDAGDTGIAGVTVRLVGTALPQFDANGVQVGGGPVSLTTTTDGTGFYSFTGLNPGTYSVIETQPLGWSQARNTIGTQFGGRRPVQDTIDVIVIPSTVGNNTTGENYNFGERLASKQDFLGSTSLMCQPLNDNVVYSGAGVAGETITNVVYSPLTVPYTVTGSSNGGIVRVQDAGSGALMAEFYAFGLPEVVGINVTTGDYNKDGYADLVLAASAGGGPRVRIVSALTQNGVMADFFAFSPNFSGGVRVASGDVNGDGVTDLIVAAGVGGGPHVKVIDGTKLNQVQADGQIAETALLASFFAFDAGMTRGLSVASGDLNGDGRAEVIVGMGNGGSTVRTFGIAGGVATQLTSVDAFAATFTGGVSLAAGDVNGDGKSDIIVGAGATGGPAVKVLRGTDGQVLQSFFAYETSFTGGVRVGAVDVDGDGRVEIVTAPGAGKTQLRLFKDGALLRSYEGGLDGGLTVAGGKPTI